MERRIRRPPSSAIVGEVVRWVQSSHSPSPISLLPRRSHHCIAQERKAIPDFEFQQTVAASLDARATPGRYRELARDGSSAPSYQAFNTAPVKAAGSKSKQVQDFLENLGHPAVLTYALQLQECGNRKALADGKQVHLEFIKSGLKADVYLGNHLILMYTKCESLLEARQIFDQMPRRNVVSWNAMIGGYAQHEHAEEAFKLFQQMQLEGVKPNRITFINILKACSSPGALTLGKQLHVYIVDAGFESDVVVMNALINMYGKSECVADARRVFDKMPEKNVVSWNSIIAVYVQHSLFEEAFELFEQMQQKGAKPCKITFITILNACACREALALGKSVHGHIVDGGFETDVIVGNALVNMYAKCGNIKHAREMFDTMPIRDLVTWTVMITGYARHGLGREAFILFQQMQQDGVKPDKITFISILNAYTGPEVLAVCKLIHACVVDRGFESDVVVGTTLVNMYGKCGCVDDARRMFNMMPGRNVVSWNVMIAVYAQHGFCEEAFKLFHQMQQEGVQSDKITFVNILSTCASPEDLALGKLLHSDIINRGIESDNVVATALVNMYGKCGSIKDACMMFQRMPKHDIVSWTTMIAAYAQHGLGKEALQIFQEMQRNGVKPTAITMISVLNACSHAGFVDEGLYYFNSMVRDHGIIPTMEHYNCIVELLGHGGQLDKAEELIMKMPFQPDSVIWMTLLGCCRIHGLIDQGKRAAEHALQLDPQLASAYVVLSNIYAAAGRWDDAINVRKLMADSSVTRS